MSIEKRRIDDPKKRITYVLGEDLQLIWTSKLWNDYEMDVPVPFQKGDILVAEAERCSITDIGNEGAFFCVAGERILRRTGKKTLVYARFAWDESLTWMCGHVFRLRLRYATKKDTVPDKIVKLSEAIQSGEVSFMTKQFPLQCKNEESTPS